MPRGATIGDYIMLGRICQALISFLHWGERGKWREVRGLSIAVAIRSFDHSPITRLMVRG